jgi:hypothetical protein
MVKVPLLEQEIDTGSVRSSRSRRKPARFRDFIPTSTVPAQVGTYLTKKQRLEAANARADAAQPEHDPEPSLDEGSGEGDPAIAGLTIIGPDSFGVFRKYLSLSSHNPDDIDPFSDIPSTSSGAALASQQPAAEPIGSNITVSPTTSNLDPLANSENPSSHNPNDIDPFSDTPSTSSGAALASRPPAAEPIGSNVTVSPTATNSDPLANSENPTEDLLLSWYSQGFTDGASGLDRLVEHLRHPRFDISQLKNFNAAAALRRFENQQLRSKFGGMLEPRDGWKCGSVAIRVPCVYYQQREEDAPEFVVDGFCYRDATGVIAKELANPKSFNDIHLNPFEEWWRPTETSDPVRVYSEIYTSDAMLQLERDLKERLKNSAGPQLETFILAALMYSDGTRLAQFGQASLWPVYMYLGNVSKYTRSRPNSFSAHHVAYLPTVSIPLSVILPHISRFIYSYRTRSKSSIINTTVHTPTLI